MIRKYKKHFGKKERVKQGNGVSLPRSNQIVNRTISDFVSDFFLQMRIALTWALIGFYLATFCKERRVSPIEKFQIPKHKYQTNHNDRNSKFQTIDF